MLRFGDYLPIGWEWKRLGDITDVNPAVTCSGPNPLVSFVTMADVSEDGYILGTKERSYESVKSGFPAFEKNDVLVAKITPCFENGKGALVRELPNSVGFGSTEFFVLRARHQITPEFLCAHTRTKEFRLLGAANMAGSAGQQRVHSSFLRDWTVPLPPTAEQRSIANILLIWNNSMRGLARQIEAKQALFAALRESLISGSRRLNPFRQTWPLVALRDLLKPSRERVGPEAQLRVYSVTKDGLVPQDEHFKKRIANENISRHLVVRDRYFALSGLNFWLGSVDVNLGSAPICISPDYRVFRIERAAEPSYFKYVVRTRPFRNLLKNAAVERASAVRKNFDRETFLASEIKLPEPDEQQAIVKILDDGARELSLLRAEHSALERQRDSLATQLLTGRVRIGQVSTPAQERS